MIAAPPLTVGEFQELPDNGMHQELSEGELIEMPPPKFRHSWVVEQVRLALAGPVYARRLGRLLSDAGFVLSRDPDTVRAPDLAFVAASTCGVGTSAQIAA